MMNRQVEVLCHFNSNGSMIPLKFKITDEEQQIHTFNIKKYKPPKTHLKSEPGYYSVSRHVPEILDYECIVEFFGIDKIVKLRYFIALHKWDIFIS